MTQDRLHAIRERMLRILGSGSTGSPPGESHKHAENQIKGSQGTGPPAQVAERLQGASVQKEDELAMRRRDVASPYYANDEWTERQIALLKEQIGEIKRYLAEGGDLGLPSCCARSNFTCLIAMSGFDSCIMQPGDCGFSLGG